MYKAKYYKRNSNYAKSQKPKNKVSKPVKKYVKKVLDQNIEDKYKIVDNIALTSTQSGVAGLTLLNGMQVGAADNLRLGNVISIKRIDVAFKVQAQAATQQYCTVYLMFDQQANGANPLITNLKNTVVAALQWLAPYNPDAVPSRYRIVRAWRCDLGVQGGATDITKPKIIQQSIYFKHPVKVQYNGTNAGNISDINKNSLFLFAISDGAPGPIVTGTVQTIYQDA